MASARPEAITPQIKADILSEALPYIRRFHGKTCLLYTSDAADEL